MLTTKEVAEFRDVVRSFYRISGRIFPWRETDDPYKILVSEIMLQQTQTDRVVKKYAQWLMRFPTVSDVAAASLADVLTEWNGLGYNRRAKYLWECCIAVCNRYNGVFPDSVSLLESLPGIGPYTARAVSTFAFHNPEVFIETNIRSVFIFTFFPDAEKVHDKDILPLIAQVVDTENPREWYYALMDYGAVLKKKVVNPSRNSRHYTKQSTFKGSLRQARGAIIRALTAHNGVTGRYIAGTEKIDAERIKKAADSLCAEGFIVCEQNANGDDLFFLV